MRGGYDRGVHRATIPLELPPRARRILLTSEIVYKPLGTTSACAENTHGQTVDGPQHRNYLRVRGEYSTLTKSAKVTWELPPRARRIRFPLTGRGGLLGTTSACAENTNGFRAFELGSWNYLRVRGEYDY